MKLLPRVSTVLFDMGNTIGHLDHGWIAGALARRGLAFTATDVAHAEYAAKAAVDEQFRARAAGSDAARQRTYFETIFDTLGVPAECIGPVVAEIHAENARRSLWSVVQPDTAAILGELRARGFTLGVVSNADGRVARSLAEYGLAEHFAVVVDSHLVGVEKPDARIFAIALAACAARPEEALFVGDIYEIDVQGARGAGIAPLLLDPLGRYAAVDCARIDSLARLLEVLPERGGRS
jgi:HAD superfamily hydrolase (TIGR01509 family)